MRITENILKLALIQSVLGFGGSATAQLPELWAARYNAVVSYARAATVDSGGNIYITGSSDNNYGTVKYDANGNLAWSASYSGHQSYADGGKAVALDAAGNVYVTGGVSGNRFYYFNGTTKTYLTDAVTVKYDSAGRQKWASSYSETGNLNYSGGALAIDTAGNVYVAGSSFVVQYAANGHQTWVVTGINGVALVLDVAGNLYITGGGTRKLDTNG